MSNYVFKIAATEEEFEQIHRMNYQAFAEEIPQHPTNPERRLVDRFHAENTYFIALTEGKLVGMFCVRDRRPFSLDQKLENLDSFLPPYRSICEIRLLTIAKNLRGAPHILQGLMFHCYDYWSAKGYDLGVMSGTTKQLKLYHHLGFVPFGPLVGNGDILFQPMYLTFEVFQRLAQRLKSAAE